MNIQKDLIKREFISCSLFCANTAYRLLDEQVDVMKLHPASSLTQKGLVQQYPSATMHCTALFT
jgi:hypothetical protein